MVQLPKELLFCKQTEVTHLWIKEVNTFGIVRNSLWHFKALSEYKCIYYSV